ncbi:MAG: efflux RND transporter periplasmic adaptor subunit [Pseudomonadota bacterium]
MIRRLPAACVVACVVAFAAALAAAPLALGAQASDQGAGSASDPLVYPGRVEAARQAALSTRLDGVVAEILFNGGDEVEAGQPLIRLDPVDAQLALAVAEAALARAQAELDGARRDAARQESLAERGISPDAVVGPARTARAAAEAALRLAQAERDRAALDLERTVIRAPIGGLISASDVIVGQYLEAEAGPPLATIVDLDRVLVAYDAPYADRLALLGRTGAATVDDLLARLRVELSLPGGALHPRAATPHTASPTVDAETGAVRVWAVFDNPDRLLRPGMAVTVRSHLHALGQ